jgi:hypothetical protein
MDQPDDFDSLRMVLRPHLEGAVAEQPAIEVDPESVQRTARRQRARNFLVAGVGVVAIGVFSGFGLSSIVESTSTTVPAPMATPNLRATEPEPPRATEPEPTPSVEPIPPSVQVSRGDAAAGPNCDYCHWVNVQTKDTPSGSYHCELWYLGPNVPIVGMEWEADLTGDQDLNVKRFGYDGDTVEIRCDFGSPWGTKTHSITW